MPRPSVAGKLNLKQLGGGGHLEQKMPVYVKGAPFDPHIIKYLDWFESIYYKEQVLGKADVLTISAEDMVKDDELEIIEG